MNLIYSPEAIKKLKRINPKDLSKIRRKIQEIKENPLCGKNLKGEMTGLKSHKTWPLRIIYTVNPAINTIYIITIDYRGSVYKS